jgi:hypothetical protein
VFVVNDRSCCEEVEEGAERCCATLYLRRLPSTLCLPFRRSGQLFFALSIPGPDIGQTIPSERGSVSPLQLRNLVVS